jgi:hypothetical protein
MINPFGVECGSPADETVDGIALVQQEFRKIRAVLAGNAGDQCFFHNKQIPFSSGCIL